MVRVMTAKTLVPLTALLALGAAVPATAADGPSVRVTPGPIAPGAPYVLRGSGWSLAPGCDVAVEVAVRAGHGAVIGSAPIAGDGTFRFRRGTAAAVKPGERTILDVTQFCEAPGDMRVGTTRTVTVRIAARRGCGMPLSVGGRAYDVKVDPALACSRGMRVLRSFLTTGASPDGWRCAHLGARAKDDEACVERAGTSRRVTARRVKEV